MLGLRGWGQGLKCSGLGFRVLGYLGLRHHHGAQSASCLGPNYCSGLEG